jgi:hypothetical protein
MTAHNAAYVFCVERCTQDPDSMSPQGGEHEDSYDPDFFIYNEVRSDTLYLACKCVSVCVCVCVWGGGLIFFFN